MKFGLTLPNRGVLFGAITVPELLDLAEIADSSGGFNSVWVGDSLFGKPRLDSITLRAALAARTRRVWLGTACRASFTLRDPVQLAYQWTKCGGGGHTGRNAGTPAWRSGGGSRPTIRWADAR